MIVRFVVVLTAVLLLLFSEILLFSLDYLTKILTDISTETVFDCVN